MASCKNDFLCTLWQGDCYIQGDRYIQVNFAKNIRQLKILGSCRDCNIKGDRIIQGCYTLVCIHWHDKFSRLNLTPETTKFMLQLSTQKEDKLLEQSQVPFTDTINLKKRNKILWQGHNSIVTTFCFKLILSATCPLVYTGLTDSSKALFFTHVSPLITLHKEGAKWKTMMLIKIKWYFLIYMRQILKEWRTWLLEYIF